MLSPQEKQQIYLEEMALARRQFEGEQAAALARARTRFRRQVRAAYRPRQSWRWALAGLLVWALAAVWALRSDQGHLKVDDMSGGIATSVLLQRCEAEVRRQLPATVQFAPPAQAAQQLSADNTGKRWRGAALIDDRPTDFSCHYSVATGALSVEIIP